MAKTHLELIEADLKGASGSHQQHPKDQGRRLLLPSIPVQNSA